MAKNEAISKSAFQAFYMNLNTIFEFSDFLKILWALLEIIPSICLNRTKPRA
jgi:hypothetical protein